MRRGTAGVHGYEMSLYVGRGRFQVSHTNGNATRERTDRVFRRFRACSHTAAGRRRETAGTRSAHTDGRAGAQRTAHVLLCRERESCRLHETQHIGRGSETLRVTTGRGIILDNTPGRLRVKAPLACARADIHISARARVPPASELDSVASGAPHPWWRARWHSIPLLDSNADLSARPLTHSACSAPTSRLARRAVDACAPPPAGALPVGAGPWTGALHLPPCCRGNCFTVTMVEAAKLRLHTEQSDHVSPSSPAREGTASIFFAAARRPRATAA
eukprot:7119661-Prymnesium_polylepis.1